MWFWRVIAGALAVLLIGAATIDMARQAAAPKRVLLYEKGTYLGRHEAPIDPATRARLRQRSLVTSAW